MTTIMESLTELHKQILKKSKNDIYWVLLSKYDIIRIYNMKLKGIES
jgi:hypothetical protein